MRCRVVGPPVWAAFSTPSAGSSRLPLRIELVELGRSEAIEHDGFEMRSFAVEHLMNASRYAFVEPQRRGARRRRRPRPRDHGRARLRAAAARRDDLRERLGRDPGSGNGQSAGRPQAGRHRRYLVAGDDVAARGALLVHDGTSPVEETARATETGHSTARDAAALGGREVGMLAIVHVSLPLQRRSGARRGARCSRTRSRRATST